VRLLHAWQPLADLLYPPRCLVCHRPPRLSRDRFCDECRPALFQDASLACPRCAMTVGPFGVQGGRCPACRHQPLGFEAALRLGVYDDQLGEAVRLIKHAVHEGLAEELGEQWAEARRQAFDTLGPDAVVPVPLHWRKRLQRGYNQSAALAFGLARRLGKPYRPRWLKRIRATEEQKAQASLAARRENVKDAFSARPDAAGQHVLLVDDVMTTGATASEAAGALLKAGSSRVTVAVLARAGG
jgi:ComF family protein